MPDIVLKIDNVYSHLVTADREFRELLHDKLRFRPKNYFHNAAYKKKRWDGWKDFFDDKTGRFLTGMLPEVRGALRVKNKDYAVIDNRTPVTWLHQSIDDQFLNAWLPAGTDPLTLHDYQPDLVNQVIKYDRGLVVAPTSSGKTFILVSLLKCLPPKTPVLFVTKSKSLVDQNYAEMKKWGVPDLGRWYDKYKEPNYVMCVTAHKDTMASIGKLLPKFKALFVDEVHECMSDVPVAAYTKMHSASVRVGFSATPFKWDKKKIDNVHKWGVKGHFGPVLKTSTTKSGVLTTTDLQKRGILSKDNCTFFRVRTPDLTYEPYSDAVKLGIEQNFDFHKMVSSFAKTRPGRTLVVVERIEQGQYLHSMIPGSTFIQGKTALDERLPALNALRAGDKFVAIVMRQIITAGINIMIHDLVNAAGGEAAQNVIQLMGRGLRRADDKAMLQYTDFLFLMNDYLRKHSEWRIDVCRSEGHAVTVADYEA